MYKKYLSLVALFPLMMSGCESNPNVDGYIFVATQKPESSIILYDTSKYNGDLNECVEWEYKITASKSKCVSGIKYRTNNKFNDVIVLCCSGGYASIVSYPGKEIIWENISVGANPHSVELLPSGNIVTCSSNDGIIRLYYSSSIVSDDLIEKMHAKEYVEYNLSSAHGLLYDPSSNTLWALGSDSLVEYSILGNDKDESLSVKATYSLPTKNGHDLSINTLNKNELFITTVTNVYCFNKISKEFNTTFDGSDKMNTSNVKGFGNNIYGNYYYVIPNYGINTPWEGSNEASWLTNVINKTYKNGNGIYETIDMKSSTNGFYKVFNYNKNYQ